ncbi:MAG: hypothetical protein ABR600_11670 [Actinomycetota bacterium]
MATTTLKAKDAFYAVIGVADTGYEKAKDIAGGVRSFAGRGREPRTFLTSTATDLRTFVTGRAGALQKRFTKRQRNVTREYNRLAKRGQTLMTRKAG